ncbi:MAG: PQQ-dependent sugar dehydrogenase, partial [Pseudomonadota bacterium]
VNRKHILSSAFAVLMGSTILAAPASAVDVNLEEVASGLTAPLGIAQPAGDDRIFIFEQPGKVKILQGGEVLDEPFLDIRNRIVDLVPDFDERGLLGMAFHPDFASNGKVYVAYSGHLNWQGDLAKKFWWSHTNTVSEFTVSADDPNKVDLTSERIISEIDWPQFNHNGHWIDFGPDGMLYISTGDGGYANDWGIGHNVLEGNGQDNATLMGKILRVNVDTDDGSAYSIPEGNMFASEEDGLPEIWANGFRNPWRCGFDMGGDNALICGDVQQNSFEEITLVEAGTNHGWREMEASHCFDFEQPNNHPEDCDTSGYVMPIMEYNNCNVTDDCKGLSVTGGYVYRGDHADWDGVYFFGDWSKQFAVRDGQLFAGINNGGEWTMEDVNVANMDGFSSYVLAFGQDNAGDVYVMATDTTGPNGGLDKIYKIAPAN